MRTDKPEAEVYLIKDGHIVAEKHWQAHRELSNTLLSVIDALLNETGIHQGSLEGVIVYQGPGSFTGLRIGITVANSIAYAHKLPIVATQSDDWVQQGISGLMSRPLQQVVPHYGRDATITKPKK